MLPTHTQNLQCCCELCVQAHRPAIRQAWDGLCPKLATQVLGVMPIGVMTPGLMQWASLANIPAQ